MKNIILLVYGVNDFFFAKDNNKISKEDQAKFVSHVTNIVNNPRYKGVVNISIPVDSNNKVNVFKERTEQSVSKLTLFTSEKMLSSENELIIKDYEGDNMRFSGNQFDFIFPQDDYEIHACGLDVNGILPDSLQEFLDLGYEVTLYSGSIKPFRNTYKQIHKLTGTKNFQYCSQKSAV